MNRKDAKDYINGRMKKYSDFINKLGAEMIEEWNNGDYRAAGMYDGQIAQYLDLAPNPYYEEYEDPSTRDPMAAAQFVSGWLYGISGQAEEHRDAIVDCFKPNDLLT